MKPLLNLIKDTRTLLDGVNSFGSAHPIVATSVLTSVYSVFIKGQMDKSRKFTTQLETKAEECKNINSNRNLITL